MFLLLRNLRYEFNRPYSRLRGNDRGESARAITKQNAHRPPGGGCRAEHDGGWGTITTMTTPSRKARHPSAERNFSPRRYAAGTQSQRGALPCGWFCGGITLRNLRPGILFLPFRPGRFRRWCRVSKFFHRAGHNCDR